MDTSRNAYRILVWKPLGRWERSKNNITDGKQFVEKRWMN
jgi:hypothetical protein